MGDTGEIQGRYRGDLWEMRVGACLGELELRTGGEELARPISRLYLPYISPISRLYLPYVSPVSPLHLSYISLHLAYLRERGQEVGQRGDAWPDVGRYTLLVGEI